MCAKTIDPLINRLLVHCVFFIFVKLVVGRYHRNDDIFNINTSLYKRMTQCPRIFISVKQLPVCVQILADIDSRTLCHSSI